MDTLLVIAGTLYQNVVSTNIIQAEVAETFQPTCLNAVDMIVIELLEPLFPVT